MKLGFLPWRPDNSDSVGRWFESSRAHQNLQRDCSFGGFLLPIITLKKAKCTGIEIRIWALEKISVVVKWWSKSGTIRKIFCPLTPRVESTKGVNFFFARLRPEKSLASCQIPRYLKSFTTVYYHIAKTQSFSSMELRASTVLFCSRGSSSPATVKIAPPASSRMIRAAL